MHGMPIRIKDNILRPLFPDTFLHAAKRSKMDPWRPQAECSGSTKDAQLVSENKFDDSFVESIAINSAGGEPADPPKKLADTDKYLNKLCKYNTCAFKIITCFLFLF